MGGPFLSRLRAALSAHVRDPLYLNGYALILNAAVSSAVGFLFWLVAARRFQAEHIGIGAAVVSASTLAALIGKAGFDAAIIRYGPTASGRGIRRLLRVSIFATLVLTCLTALVILILASGGVDSLAPLRETRFALGFFALAAATAVAWILDAYFISEQAAMLVLVRNVAFNVVKLVVPFVLAASIAVRAVPLAWGAGLAASLAVAFALLPRLLRARPSQEGTPLRAREVALYAARNYVLNVSEFLPGLLLPILVLAMLGAEANAHFFLAWTVATVAFLASKSVAQSAFAALVRQGSPGAAIRKAFVLSGLVLVPAALVFHLGAPLLLGLFGDRYGAEGANLLRLLALSILPVGVTNIYLAYLKARADGWELTLLPALCLAGLLLAMPFALARWGIEGAGLSWLAVQAAAGVYAAIRLTVALRRNSHENARPALRRRAHEG